MRADINPTDMEAITPLAVVFFQKSIIRIAGRFAEAAMANAQPTKNDTFMFLNKTPRIIARTPTPTAAILPAATFFLSVIFLPMYLSIISWATAPEDAHMSPLTVPSTVANATADMIAKNIMPNERASRGADILSLVRSITPLVIAPSPI